jgi:ferredoxin
VLGVRYSGKLAYGRTPNTEYPTPIPEAAISSPRHTVTFIWPDGQEARLEVSEDEFLLTAAYRAGLDLPSMCLQGWCITCAGRVEGPGEWDQSASLRYFPKDREAGFILLCTARARSDLVIRTHQRIAMRDNRLAHGLPTPRA